jgi:hypothetical protein
MILEAWKARETSMALSTMYDEYVSSDSSRTKGIECTLTPLPIIGKSRSKRCCKRYVSYLPVSYVVIFWAVM